MCVRYPIMAASRVPKGPGQSHSERDKKKQLCEGGGVNQSHRQTSWCLHEGQPCLHFRGLSNTVCSSLGLDIVLRVPVRVEDYHLATKNTRGSDGQHRHTLNRNNYSYSYSYS
jgi:hypothetical protein